MTLLVFTDTGSGSDVARSLRTFFPLCSCLEETAILKVFFDDDVCHGVEHNFHVFCVCGTSQVRVDFFHTLLHVQLQELRLDVVAGIVVCVGA